MMNLVAPNICLEQQQVKGTTEFKTKTILQQAAEIVPALAAAGCDGG